MKKFLFSLIIILIFNSLGISGGPSFQNISPLNTPIRVGQDVYFLSTFTGSIGCFIDQSTIYFGNTAHPFNITISDIGKLPPEGINVTVGPVTFSTIGPLAINYTFNSPGCSEIGVPGSLQIDILPSAAIPTLSQWALLIIGIFAMIFGVLCLKDRHKTPIPKHVKV